MKEIKFAENLKNLRKEQALSQTELGKLVGVNYRTVGTWERGECEPDFNTLSKLCEIFNETFDSLLT